jgi:hypothetical protein
MDGSVTAYGASNRKSVGRESISTARRVRAQFTIRADGTINDAHVKGDPAEGLTPLVIPDLDVMVNGKPIRPSFHIEPLEPGDPVPNVASWLGRVGMDAAPTSRLTARGQLRLSGPYTPIGEPGIETQSYAVVDLGTSIELPRFRGGRGPGAAERTRREVSGDPGLRVHQPGSAPHASRGAPLTDDQ